MKTDSLVWFGKDGQKHTHELMMELIDRHVTEARWVAPSWLPVAQNC